jgi:hypothetical protein
MAPSAVATNNGSTSAPPASDAHHQSHSAGKQTRSRTTIPTQSGKWILGKTIGAGSMGKVKLARKEDGSEQVRQSISLMLVHFVLSMHPTPPTSVCPSFKCLSAVWAVLLAAMRLVGHPPAQLLE